MTVFDIHDDNGVITQLVECLVGVRISLIPPCFKCFMKRTKIRHSTVIQRLEYSADIRVVKGSNPFCTTILPL